METKKLVQKGKVSSDKSLKLLEKTLAYVIVFEDGQCVVKWCGIVGSLVIHKSFNEFKSISLNDDRYII
jgi:hypothetical protein